MTMGTDQDPDDRLLTRFGGGDPRRDAYPA